MPGSPSPPAPAAYHHGDLKRVLMDAALAMVTEEQNWGFSLREVARRAGVSHNAPYRHFPEKRDLLAAVAAEGFALLRAGMLQAAAGTDGPEAALLAIGVAYVRFGVANPAHYRLMFGASLAGTDGIVGPVVSKAATGSQSVLGEIVADGARRGAFAADPDDAAALAALVLAAWSLVHGLTMLTIDGRAGGTSPERIARLLLDGVRRREAG